MTVTYSVVIPLKNEEENIADLLQELNPVMNCLGTPWELICIDDGSTDNTLQKLIELKKNQTNLRIITFDQNYGQTSAFDAGFRAAQGHFVITLDGDRQNDPKDILKLIAALKDADLVIGIRIRRRDTWNKKITSRLANFVRSRICRDGVLDTGCSLKIYRKECLDKIKLFQGMHRFFPALFKNEGFRVVQVPVNHRHRMKGVTKYNFFNRSFNTIADMFAVRWMGDRRLKYQIYKEL